jgi:hypothetical protein
MSKKETTHVMGETYVITLFKATGEPFYYITHSSETAKHFMAHINYEHCTKAEIVRFFGIWLDKDLQYKEQQNAKTRS